MHTGLFGHLLLLCTSISSSIAFSLPAAAATTAATFISPHANVNANVNSARHRTRRGASQNRMSAAVAIKGGSISVAAKFLEQLPGKLSSSPDSLFNGVFAGLMTTATAWKFLEYSKSTIDSQDKADEKPAGVKELQIKFLSVFWLLRMAEWLQGPYFYEVYASKMLNGQRVSLDMISKLFLVGFASTGLFGPWIGRFVDVCGRKLGTILFTILYGLAAISTRSNLLLILLLGRVAGGIGTSLLFSAPEAWLVGEHQGRGFDGKWLGQTFGWAYAGDALVAITAGQLASIMDSKQGPTGPFTLSLGFLLGGAILALLRWKENTAPKDSSSSGNDLTIKDAVTKVLEDKRILFVGAVQALFEGAMYIFVLQWPPAIRAAIISQFGEAASVPYGKIFSCFMASCLLGTTAFGSLQSKGVRMETTSAGMLAVAATAMGVATASVTCTSMISLAAAFLTFEICVGLYFPLIGTLRSKYIPDSHRSVIMNLFGIPLNLIVVSVFLSIKRLGVKGALACSTTSLAIATLCMSSLRSWKLNESRSRSDSR